jgi:hypothetical protein
MALDSYKKHYDFFMAWMELRLSWLDDCFNDEDMWIEELNDRSNPRKNQGLLPEIK